MRPPLNFSTSSAQITAALCCQRAWGQGVCTFHTIGLSLLAAKTGEVTNMLLKTKTDKITSPIIKPFFLIVPTSFFIALGLKKVHEQTTCYAFLWLPPPFFRAFWS
jgi:hypothetical protein